MVFRLPLRERLEAALRPCGGSRHFAALWTAAPHSVTGSVRSIKSPCQQLPVDFLVAALRHGDTREKGPPAACPAPQPSPLHSIPTLQPAARAQRTVPRDPGHRAERMEMPAQSSRRRVPAGKARSITYARYKARIAYKYMNKARPPGRRACAPPSVGRGAAYGSARGNERAGQARLEPPWLRRSAAAALGGATVAERASRRAALRGPEGR